MKAISRKEEEISNGMKSTVLAIDTTTKSINIALSCNGKIFNIEKDAQGQGYEGIITLIESLLKKARMSISDVDYFGVCVGPGSFTGLRIGIATVKGFGLALKKPIVGVSSLDILVNAVTENNNINLICPIIDAKRDLVYSCMYKKTENKLRRISNYLLISMGELLKKISSEVIFTGNAIDLYKNTIENKLGKKAVFTPEKFWYPKTSVLLNLSYEKLRKGQTKNAHTILPLYLYPKECQVRQN